MLVVHIFVSATQSFDLVCDNFLLFSLFSPPLISSIPYSFPLLYRDLFRLCHHLFVLQNLDMCFATLQDQILPSKIYDYQL
jgi:hypothetical protein